MLPLPRLFPIHREEPGYKAIAMSSQQYTNMVCSKNKQIYPDFDSALWLYILNTSLLSSVHNLWPQWPHPSSGSCRLLLHCLPCGERDAGGSDVPTEGESQPEEGAC